MPGGSDRALVHGFTLRSRSNFYYSFLFLPADKRAAIEAVYAFCRSVDDAVDSAPDHASARDQLLFWRRELAACYGDGEPSHPISRDLAGHVRRLDLSREPLEDVIRGVEMDLTRRSYETFPELALYCGRVASAVGLSCIEIFGSRGEASRRYATTLGIAFQLTNILRDLRTDCRDGRCYIPLEEMRRFGYSPEEAAEGRGGDAFRRLMEFQCARAEDLFRRAESEMPCGERRRLLAAQIMGVIYRTILRKIARSPETVLEGRLCLTRPHRLALAVGTWARTLVSSGSPSPSEP